MHGFSRRRLFAALLAGVLATAAVVVGTTSPAHAAAGAELQYKVIGTHYADDSYLALGLVPGAAPTTTSLKIVNTGTAYQQFKVTLEGSDGSISAGMSAGSTPLPNPYFTAPVHVGQSVVISLRVQLSSGDGVPYHWMRVTLRDPVTNAHLDTLSIDIASTRQTGHLRNDLFLKTGTRPYVGGSEWQIQSSAAVKSGATATFLLRLKNDGATAVPAIRLRSINDGFCPWNYLITVKRGYTDVTTAVANGTFSTGPLAPGAKVDLKATVKRVGSTSGCDAAFVIFSATGPDGEVQVGAHVPNAA